MSFATSFSRTIIIPANGVEVLGVVGDSFYLIDANAPVQIQTDVSGEKKFLKGTGERLNGEFNRVQIRNNNTFQVSIEFWAGFGEYIDKRFDIVEAQTRAKGWDGNQTLGANSTIAFNPGGGSDFIRQKEIYITNLDTENSFQVLDSDDNIFMTVFPRNNIVIATSDAIKLKNITGSDISINVGAVNYVSGDFINIT